MNVLAAISPTLKVLFERVGKPEIVNRPDLFRSGGAGAVIACNHVGWADSLWMAYAVYPRQLRYMLKKGTVQFNAIALGLDVRRFPFN
jgi:1-acyl-sn-glycerol-3-phosphate acyltransferase